MYSVDVYVSTWYLQVHVGRGVHRNVYQMHSFQLSLYTCDVCICDMVIEGRSVYICGTMYMNAQ